MAATTEKALVPALRFPEFTTPWIVKKLDQFMTFKNGINAKKEQYGKGHKFINVLDIIADEPITYETIIGSVDVSTDVFEKSKVTYGDVLFQRSSETREEAGQANVYLDREKPATFGGFVIRGKSKGNYQPIFMNLLLKTSLVRKEITARSGGSTRYNVGQATLERTPVFITGSDKEEQKIAEFLTAVDTKIQQLKRRHSLMQQYKKGVMQQLFSQQVRFAFDSAQAPGDMAESSSTNSTTPVAERSRSYPDWEEKRLGDLFERVTRKNKKNCKNVMTISAQQGLINQEKYFNKSVSAADVTGYYLLKKGEFAYNKSYSAGYPLGAIKQLTRYNEGVVSTLYICFKAKKNVVADFYEQYFEGGLLNREIHKIAQEGARNHGLLNVSVVVFFRDIQIQLPCLEEQKKIADFLGSIDAKITQLDTQITQAETFKKGLLQQMFV